MRSRKLAAIKQVLKPAPIFGAPEGDLLLVGWGSTRGAIEEAVEQARAAGRSVSSMNIQFLNPLPPGLKEAFARFKKVLTVELNYSDDWGDPLIDEDSRRYAQLAQILRAQTLHDVDCWSRVPARPFMPAELLQLINEQLENLGKPRPMYQAQFNQAHSQMGTGHDVAQN
jgi:2-oxoglutarate ferredoxin oxidoreductase subunit alpha